MTLKYTATRPDENLDALQSLEDDWTRPEDEPETVLVVARVNRYAIAKNQRTSAWQATAGFVHVELLNGTDAETGAKLLRDAYAERTGKTELPIDFGGEQ